MSEEYTPERIWVFPAYRDKHGAEPMQIASKDFAHSAIEYTRSDLMPRWRPIAELPQEWRDGRAVVLRDRFDADRKSNRCSYLAYYAGGDWLDNAGWVYVCDVGEFLDFGGKSMPD